MEKDYLNKRIFRSLNILYPDSSKKDPKELNSEIYIETVITNHMKLTGSTDSYPKNYDMKILILPNSGYETVKENVIPAYKLIKNTSNFNNIKRVFLIGYSHLSLKNKIFLSAYSSYDTSLGNLLIDKSVYNELINNEGLNGHVEYFEVNPYEFTRLVEEKGSLNEQRDVVFQGLEDNEHTFDLHIEILNAINLSAKIVPIWVNVLHTDKEVLENLGKFFRPFIQDNESLFIYSTNLTYFGRIYNYFGENEKKDPKNKKISPEINENLDFKSKFFLREKSNEDIVIKYLTSIDKVAIDYLTCLNSEKIKEISNLNYCKQLFITLINSIKENQDIFNYEIKYSIKRHENIDDIYELNLISFLSLAYYTVISPKENY